MVDNDWFVNAVRDLVEDVEDDGEFLEGLLHTVSRAVEKFRLPKYVRRLCPRGSETRDFYGRYLYIRRCRLPKSLGGKDKLVNAGGLYESVEQALTVGEADWLKQVGAMSATPLDW